MKNTYDKFTIISGILMVILKLTFLFNTNSNIDIVRIITILGILFSVYKENKNSKKLLIFLFIIALVLSILKAVNII